MDTEKTRAFYSQLSGKDICGCAYCQNYVRQIRAAYPEAADYLSRLGVDVEKPLETMPLEQDSWSTPGPNTSSAARPRALPRPRSAPSA